MSGGAFGNQERCRQEPPGAAPHLPLVSGPGWGLMGTRGVSFDKAGDPEVHAHTQREEVSSSSKALCPWGTARGMGSFGEGASRDLGKQSSGLGDRVVTQWAWQVGRGESLWPGT